VGRGVILLPKIWALAAGGFDFVSREDAKARRKSLHCADLVCRSREALFKVACGDK
jgi:hypothetical protein